jgi:hypothetical protein
MGSQLAIFFVRTGTKSSRGDTVRGCHGQRADGRWSALEGRSHLECFAILLGQVGFLDLAHGVAGEVAGEEHALRQVELGMLRWSTPKEVVRLEVGIAIEEDCNGEEEAQAGRDRCEVAAG